MLANIYGINAQCVLVLPLSTFIIIILIEFDETS